jgi:hypothetical protein
MARFIAGMMLGIFIGFAASSYAAGIFGSGILHGWTVTKDDDEVCADPAVDTGIKEIECE